jgi:hypothetical protein
LTRQLGAQVTDNTLHPVADQWGNTCSYIQSNYAGQHASKMHMMNYNDFLLQHKDLALAVNISVFVDKKVLDLLLAVPMGCGFTLQNRGSGFVLDKNHPNALKAGINEYACISLPDVLYREVNAHTIQLSLLLQLEAANCSLATELWVVLCRFVFKICSSHHY